MTPTAASLTLSASPRSVQDARRWVIDACHAIGRPDLVECAELAVSELVTNALLHGEPPLVVRLGGTRTHPRIEVADGSVEPPSPNSRMTDDEELLSTVGRGLGLVAMCSAVWGVRIHRDGKVVWFVPRREARADASLTSLQIEYEDLSDLPLPDPELDDPVLVRVLGLPTQSYIEFRHHYREIRRELRLLALASEDSYPIARHLSELFVLFERDFRLSSGTDAIQRAIETGNPTVDVDVLVDRASISTIAQMIDVLELADAFCRAERLLSVAATPPQRAFTRWYLGEFISQGRGRPPRPWEGGYVRDAELHES
ncbi:ATP-binding region, ATPase domain protein [metagenome]|uniref:ATP-binding region, ATPase domain protein n=1 Tax=metagenome TaxID=256318 RepID=A0A2P2C028_9ZZZZ